MPISFKSPFVLLQYCVPHHFLSRCVGAFMACRKPWLKNRIINWFVKRYQVDLSEAEFEKASDYATFNDFFTRQLKPGARPLVVDGKKVLCPADGCISQIGGLRSGDLLQAKGQYYSAQDLLADKDDAQIFQAGEFATIYLSPKDYHRVHMPVSGRLLKMTYVPGRLFSVNPLTAEQVPGLFARNERMVALFETELGRVAVVMVGAMIVAGIETAWAGRVTPASNHVVQHFSYESEQIVLEQGDEVGRFFLGSTVILLFENGAVEWGEQLGAGDKVNFAQPIADVMH